MVSVTAQAGRRQVAIGVHPAQFVRSLASPRAVVDRSAALSQAALSSPSAFAQQIAAARQREGVVDMGLEMVDVQALDIGKYHAMIIQDPTDKTNIRGFFHLAVAYPLSMRNRNMGSWEDRTNWGITRLAQRMNEWTPVRTDVTHRLSFGSSEFFKTP
jgi:hypothetical protein